jgi:hypothetical protein
MLTLTATSKAQVFVPVIISGSNLLPTTYTRFVDGGFDGW